MKLHIAVFALVFPACVADGTEIDLTHTFHVFTLESGEEVSEVCQSWTLDNDEMLFINSVEMTAGSGWHHSNWFFVPDNVWDGPDGTWECDERGFSQPAAGSIGGVLFAQSTQASAEIMAFPEGVAIPIPPKSRIVGNVHLLNASDTPVETDITLGLTTITREQTEVWLAPMFLEYHALAIPPQSRSQFTTSCDFETEHRRQFDVPPDFRIYYLLPHYHDLGVGMEFEALGPDGDTLMLERESTIGSPLGHTFDPPFEMSGRTGMRFSCTFDNPRSDTVRWGIGDQEMCMFMAFTDSPLLWGGGILLNATADEQPSLVDGNGVAQYERECDVFAFPSSHFWDVTNDGG